jgi:hypothetical protein
LQLGLELGLEWGLRWEAVLFEDPKVRFLLQVCADLER